MATTTPLNNADFLMESALTFQNYGRVSYDPTLRGKHSRVLCSECKLKMPPFGAQIHERNCLVDKSSDDVQKAHSIIIIGPSTSEQNSPFKRNDLETFQFIFEGTIQIRKLKGNKSFAKLLDDRASTNTKV